MRCKINTNGIRFKLFMLGSLPTLLLVALLTYYFIGHQHDYLEKSLNERGQTITKQLAVASIYGVFSGNKLILQDLANDLFQEQDIALVVISDSQYKPLARAGNADQLGEENLLIFKAPVIIQALPTSADESDLGLLEYANEKEKKLIGSVKLGLSLDQINNAEFIFLRNSLIIIFVCFALVTLLAMRLGRAISVPIINLTQVAGDLANGNMHSRAKPTNTTEIATLCDSFNAMAVGLQQTQNYLQQQIHKAIKELTTTMEELEEKNKSLEKTTKLAVMQNETKSQFLAHISHEIRTPMNGVIGFIDLLSQSDLTTKQKEQAQLIKSSAGNLLTIVNEILDYSSLEMGNFKMENVTFDIRECLENAVSSILPRTKNVQLIVDVDPKTPSLIISDPTRIRQVLTNLVGNACKYTKQGFIIIRCTYTRKSRLFISVSDTGVGIAKETFKDLFLPFLQASEYAVDNELGTGLGLTISKNITEKMGGRIGANSRLGKGSVFWFEIPVETADEPAKNRPDTLVTLIDSIQPRKKALTKQLKHLGYRIRNFSDLQHYNPQSEQPEIIIYGPGVAIETQADLDSELIKAKDFIDEIPLLSIVHQLANLNQENTLPFPCRSAFLQQIIESSGSHSAPIVTSTLPKQCRHFPIFIADDNEINRILLKSQLENWSDNITLAEDGKQAWSFLQNYKYQLILLDLQMPFYSGLQLLEKVKDPHCLNYDTPIIAITAHAQSHQCQTLIDAGFDECLIKPVMIEQLDEILNVWQPLENEDENQDEFNEGQIYIKQMLEKTSQNKALAVELFNKLFTELPEQINAIEHALSAEDLELARTITHKLHGSVGFCGFNELKTTANRLETQLLDKQAREANNSFYKLQRQIEQFTNLKHTILTNLTFK